MWQFELLGRVLPAFTALAENPTHQLTNEDIQDDAGRCRVDFIQIGMGLFKSRGEWAPGLEMSIIEDLLWVLNERLPKKKGIFGGIFPRIDNVATISRPSGWEKLTGLNDLSDIISPKDVFSFDECSQLEGLSESKKEQYRDLFGTKVKLFRKEEMASTGRARRRRFLGFVEQARTHLMDIYFRNMSEAESLSLLEHPSYGMKRLANSLYHILKEHWKCNCLPKSSSAKEARLNLTRHRNLVPRVPKASDKSPSAAKFEVLLLACKDHVDWKVANFEIRNSSYSQDAFEFELQAVQKDICSRLELCEKENLKVDFLAINNELWHANSGFLDQNLNQHLAMDSLDQLLGESRASSRLSKFHIRDQILLCYNLANSMLYLYPRGFWVHTPWSSKEVCFIRPSHDSQSSTLTSPYLAVKLKSIKNQGESTSPFEQVHKHPVLLRLGIILLEIATGIKFEESHEQEQLTGLNKDNRKAFNMFKDIQEEGRKDSRKRLPSGLCKAIDACLVLKPTPNISAVQLTSGQEGPIRQYILSCIVGPLALDLQSFGVALEESHPHSTREMQKENLHQSVTLKDGKELKQAEALTERSNRSIQIATETGLESLRNGEICLFANRENASREEMVDQTKYVKDIDLSIWKPFVSVLYVILTSKSSRIISADEWWAKHNATCSRIDKLRGHGAGKSIRVKIAILDSGIDLSDFHEVEIDEPVKVKYRSWVGDPNRREDDVGHGTHLAYLLRKTAPNADIYVARVFKERPSIKSSAECIAQAIHHCVDEWEVDMIVMSFGFGEEDTGIYDSIRYAASRDIVMFAAACNDGKNLPGGVAWPAKDINVICVHSADGHGTPSTFTPSPQDDMRVMVLGECVDSAWPPKFRSSENCKRMSGTSCAAPIAAGIAALLLDFARDILSDTELKALHRVASIQKLFRRISNHYGGYHWIRHWSLFDSKQVNIDWIKGEIQYVLRNA